MRLHTVDGTIKSYEAKDGPVLHVLAVVAHPDDESFVLGSVIGWLRRRSISVSLLVYTHGEASTIPTGDSSAELGDVRARELAAASDVLGLEIYHLYSYKDGRLKDVPLEERVRRIEAAAPVDALLAIDDAEVTRHLDHAAATEAAAEYAARNKVGLYLWTLPQPVTEALNARFKTPFRGRRDDEIHHILDVAPDRELQWKAIRCHQSQAGALQMVDARLKLLGNYEHIVEPNTGHGRYSPFQ